MVKETILEKAKKVSVYEKTYRKISVEEGIEVVLAWLRDEIGITQINVAMGNKNKYSGNVLYLIASWLRAAYRRGKIKIIK